MLASFLPFIAHERCILAEINGHHCAQRCTYLTLYIVGAACVSLVSAKYSGKELIFFCGLRQLLGFRLKKNAQEDHL